MSKAAALYVDEIRVGQDLPELLVDISSRLIVAGAIASRDYQNVHHDQDAARGLGSPDIFMNILTTNGLVGRFISDWAGPEALLRKINIRLGAPNYPGDSMKLSGEVTACNIETGDVELDIKGKNSLGYHVTGTAVVQLARRSEAI